jgi:hypothetical protein
MHAYAWYVWRKTHRSGPSLKVRISKDESMACLGAVNLPNAPSVPTRQIVEGKRLGVAVRNARKNEPASDPRGARRRLTESLPTSAFGTTPIGLFPRPPTADRRASSPRPRASPPPMPRPSSPSFGKLQSEPPILGDIAAPNLATRSRACLTSVSPRHGFVPLSRPRQAGIDRDVPGCGRRTRLPRRRLWPSLCRPPRPVRAKRGPSPPRSQRPRVRQERSL